MPHVNGGLQAVRRALMTELRAKASITRFDEAKRRWPALAGHETPLSVLAVLGDENEKRWAEREALTRALVAEEKERPHPLWAAILLHSFYPMLTRLRCRIFGDDFEPEDLDQLVVATFLDVVHEFPLDEHRDRTCMHLRQRTQRRVFRAVREEHALRVLLVQDEVDDIEPVPPDAWPGCKAPRGERQRMPEAGDYADAIAMLTSRAASLDPDHLELVITTLVRGEKLRLYVDRIYSDLDRDERTRIYQKLKRQRSRTIASLRPLLADLRCPRSEGGGLCPSGAETPDKEEASDGK